MSMSAKEALCVVVTGINKQGEFGYDEKEGCQYENEQGRCCGVGVALTPELRDLIKGRGFNGKGVPDIFKISEVAEYLAIEGRSKQESIDFWSRCQRGHDLAALKADATMRLKFVLFTFYMSKFAWSMNIDLSTCD